MGNEYYKVKNGVSEKIDGIENLEQLLKDGYVVTEVIDLGSNKTKIVSHSPRTYEEYKKIGGC